VVSLSLSTHNSMLVPETAGRDTSFGIATRYGLDGPEIESWWGKRFLAPLHTSPEAHPAFYTMGTRSSGRKEAGPGVDHPLQYSAEVKERVELYTCYASGPS